MSLYLSEWIDGYETFLDFGEMSWSPEIQLLRESEAVNGLIQTTIYIFDPIYVHALYEMLGDNVGDRFLKRLNVVNNFIFKRIGVYSFLKAELDDALQRNNKDLESTSVDISLLFSQFLSEYEFWHRINLVEIYANLIFYGTIDFPKPAIFYVPPIKRFNLFPDGYYGYYPDEDDYGDDLL